MNIVPRNSSDPAVINSRFMLGMMVLMLLLFGLGYHFKNWTCLKCYDLRSTLLFGAATILGFCSFVGSLVLWEDLSCGLLLLGLLGPLLLGLLWLVTASLNMRLM